MKFELDETQVAELKAWQEKIKELFGEYGSYDYTFSPCGIGIGVRVRSHLTRTELDLSHVENW
jgi:hypothetical protein